jgi:DNA (cytosine-5)-methyltransferase 1
MRIRQREQKGNKMLASSDHAALTAVSLFSGAGGMDVGMKSAGFSVLMANDIDPDACATYRENHGAHIIEGSVHDVLPLLDHLDEIDLMFGGPPCQGFSVAGKMDPNDERSKLMFTFFDAVRRLKPKAFVCENVKAFAALEKWSDIRLGITKNISSSYLTKMVVLNAKDFGVPQSRERMFLIGIDRDKFPGSQKDFDNLVADGLGAQASKPVTIGDIVRKLGRPGTAGNDRTCAAKVTFCKNPVMRKSPYAGMLFNGAGRPLSAKGWSSTLPASMGGNKTPIVDDAEIFDGKRSFVEQYHARLTKNAKPRQGVAPDCLRRLTVDECLAIQTFPADYILCGPRSAHYRQIGNAVPCKLAEVVGRVARNAIEMILAGESSFCSQAIAAE